MSELKRDCNPAPTTRTNVKRLPITSPRESLLPRPRNVPISSPCDRSHGRFPAQLRRPARPRRRRRGPTPPAIRKHHRPRARRRRPSQHHRRRGLPDGGCNRCVGSGGGGYAGADSVVEGSVAVWAVGYGWGEQGGGEDGGVCEGCGEGVREADGGQGEAGEGSVGLGNVVSGICGCHNPRSWISSIPKLYHKALNFAHPLRNIHNPVTSHIRRTNRRLHRPQNPPISIHPPTTITPSHSPPPLSPTYPP